MATVKKVVKKKSRVKRKVVDDPYDIEIPGVGELNEPSDDFFEYYLLLYGSSGIGKSSLFSTNPNTITAQFEPKRRNLKIRMNEFRPRKVHELEAGEVDPWRLFKAFIEKCESDKTVDNIVVDNVVECYRCCENHILLTEELEEVPTKDFGYIRGKINREFELLFNNLKFDSRMGVIFTCHAKEREGEIDSGTTDTIYGPSCSAAVFEWMKKAMDFAFYYGPHNGKRTIHCRWDTIWTKCSVQDKFLDPDGVPLKAFDIPDQSTEPDSASIVLKAFNNEIRDSDWEPDRPKRKKKTKFKRSV